MTIRKTAYDTTACRGFQIHKVINPLEAALVSGWLDTYEQTDIFQLKHSSESVPPFAHPLVITRVDRLNNNEREERLVVDLRAFGSYDERQHTYKISNKIDYAFATRRAQLNRIWMTEEPILVRDLSTLPLAAFASWISEGVAKRYFLDPREQLNVAILAGIFYLSLFNDRTEETQPYTEMEKQRLIKQLSIALRVQTNDIEPLVKERSIIPDLHAFCVALQLHSGSVRLKEINHGFLITALGSSWFGANHKEILAVALEHPPTWITVVYMGFVERTYKDSGIAKILERRTFQNGMKEFVHSLNKLLEITDVSTDWHSKLIARAYNQAHDRQETQISGDLAETLVSANY